MSFTFSGSAGGQGPQRAAAAGVFTFSGGAAVPHGGSAQIRVRGAAGGGRVIPLSGHAAIGVTATGELTVNHAARLDPNTLVTLMAVGAFVKDMAHTDAHDLVLTAAAMWLWWWCFIRPGNQ